MGMGAAVSNQYRECLTSAEENIVRHKVQVWQQQLMDAKQIRDERIKQAIEGSMAAATKASISFITTTILNSLNCTAPAYRSAVANHAAAYQISLDAAHIAQAEYQARENEIKAAAGMFWSVVNDSDEIQPPNEGELTALYNRVYLPTQQMNLYVTSAILACILTMERLVGSSTLNPSVSDVFAGICGAGAILWNRNRDPSVTKKASEKAMLLAGGALGGLLTTVLSRSIQSSDTTNPPANTMQVIASMTALVTAHWIAMKKMNKQASKT
jgi:hypothetical protein